MIYVFTLYFPLTLTVGISMQPEMEMVSRGLEKHLKLEQREHLMFLFSKVCGEDSQRIAREALGLVQTCTPFYRYCTNNYSHII